LNYTRRYRFYSIIDREYSIYQKIRQPFFWCHFLQVALITILTKLSQLLSSRKSLLEKNLYFY